MPSKTTSLKFSFTYGCRQCHSCLLSLLVILLASLHNQKAVDRLPCQTLNHAFYSSGLSLADTAEVRSELSQFLQSQCKFCWTLLSTIAIHLMQGLYHVQITSNPRANWQVHTGCRVKLQRLLILFPSFILNLNRRDTDEASPWDPYMLAMQPLCTLTGP